MLNLLKHIPFKSLHTELSNVPAGTPSPQFFGGCSIVRRSDSPKVHVLGLGLGLEMYLIGLANLRIIDTEPIFLHEENILFITIIRSVLWQRFSGSW